MAKNTGRGGWATLAALVAALGMSAMPTHGQVTGHPMTNANIRGAVRECAAESQVGPATSANNCSTTSQLGQWDSDAGDYISCDATFDCPTSQEEYGAIETWDTAGTTCFALDADNACSASSRDGLFAYMTGFNKAIRDWSTAAVTSYKGMFFGAVAFNQPLNFNTAAGTDFSEMFKRAIAFNQPLNFNTAAGTHFKEMFRDTVAFNQPLNWDVGAGTDFSEMFEGAVGFDQDLADWRPTAPASVRNMFADSAVSSDVRDAGTTALCQTISVHSCTGTSSGEWACDLDAATDDTALCPQGCTEVLESSGEDCDAAVAPAWGDGTGNWNTCERNADWELNGCIYIYRPVWGVTGAVAFNMYSDSCLEDVANGVDPGSGDWSCLPATCDTLTCGSGTTLRAGPVTISCAGDPCDADDQDTCCAPAETPSKTSGDAATAASMALVVAAVATIAAAL